jgi:alpha-acetolactate decarboxylase
MRNATCLTTALLLLTVLTNCRSTLGQEVTETTKRTDDSISNDGLIQYGEMHKVIGLQQHQARVRLADLLKTPHLFAVGALEGLKGEISVLDGQPTVTGVDKQFLPKTIAGDSSELQATMLIGAYINSWLESKIPSTLSDEELDDFIQSQIEQLGRDPKVPAMFRIIGRFKEVNMHVINGACPVHARIRNVEIAELERPSEIHLKSIEGEVVGVFAMDAVGKLTHPATKSHKHLVFKDGESNAILTGHVEALSVETGSRLFLSHLPED